MPFIGEISALGAAFMWSCSSFLFTSVAGKIGAIQVNISRMIIAALLLAVTIYIFGTDYNMSLNQLIYLSISGLIGLAVGDTFLYRSFNMVGPRVSLLIMSSSPALAAFLAFLAIGERMSLLGVIGIAITLSGIALVILEKRNGNAQYKITGKGLLFAFLAAAGQGIGLIFAKLAFVEGALDGVAATFVRLAAAVLIMVPAVIAIGKYKNPAKLFRNDLKTLGLLSIGSVIGPFLGITLSIIAIKHAEVGVASTLLATVPILMLPLSRLIKKEKITLKSSLGAIIAVGGVALLFWH